MKNRVESEILSGSEGLARRAAEVIAQHARSAVQARGRFLFAVSGGSTPRRMLELLAEQDLPWASVHVFQVDERVTEITNAARNFAQLRESLLRRVEIPAAQIHPMPVEEQDLDAAGSQYAAALRRVAGSPSVLDLIHLGLGGDGHTASLVPGDAALDEQQQDVAVTGPYQGLRRMTLTYPVLARARFILWLVSGSDKAAALLGLQSGDQALPAARVPAENALLLTDIVASS